MPRMKIVCTIGPASESPKSIREWRPWGRDSAGRCFCYQEKAHSASKCSGETGNNGYTDAEIYDRFPSPNKGRGGRCG
jgi:hypothetical protein